MRLLMKLIYIFILLSFYYPNYSYYGLILPTSSSHLLSADIRYNLKKNLLFDNLLFDNLSTSLIKLPNNINLGLLKYKYNRFGYYMESSIHSIHYGNFMDAESNYNFSSNDIILKHQVSKKINQFLYYSGSLKYINSTIDNYHSNVLASELEFYYLNNQFILSSFFTLKYFLC